MGFVNINWQQRRKLIYYTDFSNSSIAANAYDTYHEIEIRIYGRESFCYITEMV